ncbi:MAG: aldehyde dehydrogenase family protein [Phycisphaerae bacterium]
MPHAKTPTSQPIECQTYGLWLDGRWVDAADGRTFERISPGHGVPVAQYALASADDVDRGVAAAARSFNVGPWRHATGDERQRVLAGVAALLRQNVERLGRIEALESGKPIRQARDEVGWAASLWDYAATLTRHLRGDTYGQLGADVLGLTLREPLGVVGLITPWNFPLLIASQKLPFALAAGCSCVVKPSELTGGTTLVLAELLQQAGLPDGVVNVVTGYGTPAGSRICEHPDVEMVSFTGSTGVGKAVVAASGSNLKKVSLELGGKNPQIIFPDADLEAAVDAVVFGCYFNMGECCNSGSRLLLHRDVPESFIDKVLAAAASVKVGDPLDETVQYGAIIDERQFAKIEAHVEQAKQTATLRTGGGAIINGSKASGGGRYFQPTVFTDVPPDAALAREEVFGPVLSVQRFADVDEAVRIANGTMYGLSASVWSRDIDTLMGTARRIRAGTIWMNTFLEGTPELPFGGYAQSGLGRELGRYAAEEYTETKTLYLRTGKRANAWLK